MQGGLFIALSPRMQVFSLSLVNLLSGIVMGHVLRTGFPQGAPILPR